MAYDSIFSRSFSQYHELRKLRCVALLLCFIITFSLCNILKQSAVNLELSMALGLKMLIGFEKINGPQQTYNVNSIYNLSNSRSDVLEINGDIRIHGKSATVFIASSLEGFPRSWTMEPYARKGDVFVMNYVRKWKINYQVTTKSPNCVRNFSIPAILFSTGGYTGNQFHDFTDLLIPLYLTSRPFNGAVIFLVTDKRYPWTSKYKVILEELSQYDIINIDKEKEVLCFTRMIFGLKAHKEFGINPSEFPYYSIMGFRQFLRSTYSLERKSINNCRWCKIRPRMLIISRKNSRFLKNEVEVAKLAQGLGFDVMVEEIVSNLSIVAKFVNTFDVIMGVHGAGLTNMVFLPNKAVVIEIIPFGLELLARPYFQSPAKEMNLRYLEYKVSLNESSLLGKYPVDSEVYRNPGAIQKKGFLGFRSIYLDNQNISLDCGRFRETLLKALKLVCN
ncbi:protein O-GlcNAc transferase [Handroanthus impetiginosus]|uniref:Protein O-GlcNAc transferase n=1 Tax=Handroanthus impetiginosus TaxID=429701 RepID=A0A2G9HY84_9LAMI|nr:protein O-GlcNAc transferase [Handroanthus impetiginosus]